MNAIENSELQARAQLESIIEMLEDLESEDSETVEDAQQRIQDDPLSICVRSDWQNIGEPLEPAEFEILLCTGGPAVRIIGKLDMDNQPERPRLQHQDWGTPWTEVLRLTDEERAALLQFCQQFWFTE